MLSDDNTEITWNGTPRRRSRRIPAIVLSNVPRPERVSRLPIMQVLRPVDADPDTDVLFGEEIAPGIVDQRSVGLE